LEVAVTFTKEQYDDSEMAPEEAYRAIVRAWDSDGSSDDAEDYREY
jgi:hypothetical protein